MKQMGQLCTLECLFCKSMGLPYSPFETQTARKLNLRQACFAFYCLGVTAIISKVLIKYPHLEKKKLANKNLCLQLEKFKTLTQSPKQLIYIFFIVHSKDTWETFRYH